MSQPLLQVDNLAKRFDGIVATDDLTLGVVAGELHAVIGPNGAGKTTLISQLTGQLAPKMGARRRRDRQRVPARRGARHPGPPGLRRVQGRDRPLTKAWAAEFGPAGARVNAVSPGAVRTPPAEILGEMFDQMASATPLGRAASADEVAAAITHLASDDASYITGAIPPVDAGMGAG